jgi:predicted DNA-binding transcriptional regulator AlpA
VPDWTDYDVLSFADVARRFGITDRTLRRWTDDGYFPRATTFGRQIGWRWGQIRRWMKATEFLQGLGLTRLVPPEEAETEVDEGATGGHSRTPTGHSRTSGDIGPEGGSGTGKRR